MDWIYKNTNQLSSMTLAEMQNNAQIIKDRLTEYGWTLNAICGVLGNMQHESYLNPAQWQSGYPIGSAKGGYGLVQWTPSTKYTDWATNNGHPIYDGDWQLYFLDTQAGGTEYIATSSYPLTYQEFKTSTQSAGYLALVFLKNYERAGVEAIVEREANADYWYNYFYDQPPIPPIPPRTHKKLPLFMYFRLRKPY